MQSATIKPHPHSKDRHANTPNRMPVDRINDAVLVTELSPHSVETGQAVFRSKTTAYCFQWHTHPVLPSMYCGVNKALDVEKNLQNRNQS